MNDASARWDRERAWAWHATQPWRLGCNFLPSTAIHQRELWGQGTFDPAVLDRELGWAAAAGLDTLRVYLHDLAWQEDTKGFLGRMDHFLDLAAARGITPLLVFFDDCWHEPQPGPPPAPRPGVHNSGWEQSPGHRALQEPGALVRLEDYVSAVLQRFGQDERVLAWDLYNEPTNDFLPVLSATGEARAREERTIAAEREARRARTMALLDAVFRWAWRMRPAQPLTAGLWSDDPSLNERLAALSDVISFHHYRSGASLERQIARLRAHDRPLLCTEYLARTTGCTFASHLPVFAREGVHAWHWGLVDGKSQTKYSWTEVGEGEPEPWFHDLLRGDGSPYDATELKLIRSLKATTPGGFRP